MSDVDTTAISQRWLAGFYVYHGEGAEYVNGDEDVAQLLSLAERQRVDLARIRAENERLRSENEQLKTALNEYEASIEHDEAFLDADSRARLRAALGQE